VSMPRQKRGDSTMLRVRSDRDHKLENALRPKTLLEYVGQERIKRILSTSLKAARARGEAIDHVLLHGGPGLGKTTLAMILANEFKVHIFNTSGAALERGADLLSQLNDIQEKDILFIDEIHRLKKPVEELLYPVLEDFRLDIGVGKGASARMVSLSLARFTLIGATTHLGMLSAPFRNRFGLILRLEPYQVDELFRILNQSALKLKCNIVPEAAREIARRSRGTPRIANHLLKRSRDHAQAHGISQIGKEVVHHALEEMGIDSDGLDEVDRRLLELLVNRYNGGPVGLKTLSIAVGEDPQTVEDFYEPYLIQAGFLMRTSQGRKATSAGKEKFGR